MQIRRVRATPVNLPFSAPCPRSSRAAAMSTCPTAPASASRWTPER
jgi:hypothetical protein